MGRVSSRAMAFRFQSHLLVGDQPSASPSLLGHRRNGNHTLRNSPKIARDQEVGLARSSGVNRDRHVEEVSSLRCAM